MKGRQTNEGPEHQLDALTGAWYLTTECTTHRKEEWSKNWSKRLKGLTSEEDAFEMVKNITAIFKL